MLLRDRFIFDPKENILFINLAALRIESRQQVDEICGATSEIIEQYGGRTYSIVNYEGTEIAPEIVDYYGERIKELYDRYSLTTVRYSSSGFTRSMLRYLGAAKDLESNIFATREEAIRAIQELKDRSRSGRKVSPRWLFSPRRSLVGKLAVSWLIVLGLLIVSYLLARLWLQPESLRIFRVATELAVAAVTVVGLISSAILWTSVIRPLHRMEELAGRLRLGGIIEAMEVTRQDEVGQLAQTINEAAQQLQQEIERLSGLYHISLMMGSGAEVSQICELLTRKIARLLGAEVCVILLYDEREKYMLAQVPAYGMEDRELLSLRFAPEEKSIATRVFMTGEPYMTNDARRDPLLSAKAAGNIRELLAIPLKAGQHMLGTLEVINKEGGFLEEEKRLATIFASQAAHLLSNAQLFERLRESEERYRQIFENAVDGLYRSAPSGKLVTINPALALMLGYKTPEELDGINIIEDLLLDQAAGSELILQLAEHGQVLDLECDLRRQSGEPMPARLSIRVVTDAADGQVFHLGIVKDVTDQKRLAQQLIISERLAVVGELVAGVAHEVRNPLFGITTTLSALARSLKDRKTVQPFIDVVMTEVSRLNYLMEQLLEHSRPIRLDGDVSALRIVIEEVAEEFRSPANEKGVDLCIEYYDPEGPRVDRRKMHGVFTNLFENALQHTGRGGQIRLATTSETNGAAEVQIEVSDTGAGIAIENQHKVFEPFFTTRPNGVGLGLAIVRKTIHDHGGTITLRSNGNSGTTFVIKLPLG
ncbi:MAG TPA: ATP-binding protein [Pyrinomonadaceae bacterium]|jgi:PAS domain S-box-containing protein|nr:ATP-binding protein [Pyrinomonadaceae bacterium]